MIAAAYTDLVLWELLPQSLQIILRDLIIHYKTHPLRVYAEE